jgi:peptidoglycan-N-acetylglucosamine deacetylase
VSLSFTFDDGPDEEWTPRVLDALRALGVHATFFLTGERVRGTPWLARKVAEEGHEIALHCHRHVRHIDLSEAEIEADTEAALVSLSDLGLRAARWRTPWGICTPASHKVAARHELELVRWTIDTHDWRGDPSAQMLNRAAANLGDGGIVLMHDALGPGSERAGCQNTLALIPRLAALAQARGLALAPLAEARSSSEPAAHAVASSLG